MRIEGKTTQYYVSIDKEENEKLKAELKALRTQLVRAWEALSEIAGSQRNSLVWVSERAI